MGTAPTRQPFSAQGGTSTAAPDGPAPSDRPAVPRLADFAGGFDGHLTKPADPEAIARLLCDARDALVID